MDHDEHQKLLAQKRRLQSNIKKLEAENTAIINENKIQTLKLQDLRRKIALLETENKEILHSVQSSLKTQPEPDTTQQPDDKTKHISFSIHQGLSIDEAI